MLDNILDMTGLKSPDIGTDGTKTLSRRDFLKIAGAAAGGALLANKTGAIDYGASVLDPESVKVVIPEIVHGIEVYGLGEEIRTGYHARLLYEEFDKRFDAKLNPELLDNSRVEQRESLLERNKRYLEVVVSKSAYESFLTRREETGVDFVEWIQMHVDLMNRTAENAKPQADISTQLLRVAVISDNFEKNPSKYSKDMDATWFIKEDYREPSQPGANFFAVYQDKSGYVEIRRPEGFDTNDKRKWIFPPKQDSLTNKNNVWIDFGLVHEWSHVLWNLPDEYTMDVHASPFKQPEFIFDTGAYHEPWLSPYLSYLIKRANKRGQRGYMSEPEGLILQKNFNNWYFNELPNVIIIKTANNSETISAWVPVLKKPSRPRFGISDFYYGITDFNSPTEVKGSNSEVIIKADDLRKKDEDLTYPINTIFVRMGQKELYFPIAIFNMSKIAGNDNVSYNVEFEKIIEDPSFKTQTVKLVDSSDLVKFREELQGQEKQILARMKISGTSTWCFWLLQK